MEEKKSVFTTLNSIEFNEWINIPGPLIQALDVFKQCFSEHSRRISELYLELDTMTEKVQFKIRSLNEVIANTNELIQNQQETILKKVKERGEFLKNDMNVLKNKITEENLFRQKVMNETLFDIKEKVERSIKIVNSTMTPEEVQKAISDKSSALHTSILAEVKDQILKPITEKLLFDIKLVNDKLSKGLENTNSSIKKLEKNAYEESQIFHNSQKELELEQASLKASLFKGFREKTTEIEELEKKIKSCKSKSFELETYLNLNLSKNTKSIESLTNSISLILDKIKNFENQQQVFSRTNSSKKPLKAATEVQKLHEINVSELLENELKLFRRQIEYSVESLKKEIDEKLAKEIGMLEEKLNTSRLKLEQATLEIKDKLTWLPINLAELKGMSPNDARLFTIEARLRAEENSRIQAFTSIEKSLESIRKHSASPLQHKIHDRRTPDLKYSGERLVRFSENSKERNPTSITEGIIFESFEGKRMRNRKSRSKIVFS